jgi:hypothetical protein
MKQQAAILVLPVLHNTGITSILPEIKIGHELTSRYIFKKLLFFMKYVGNIGSV